MQYRRLALSFIMVLALLLPVAATAQSPTPNRNLYSLWAQLRGDTEVPAGDPDGFGYARITIDLDAGQLCFQLSVANTDVPTAAHIHEGGPGVAGPVVVPLAAPSEGLVKGCVAVTADMAAAIVANPGGYYVNVHAAEFPAGAVRGQLALLGDQAEVVVPDDGMTVETLAEGLNNPRGIAVAGDGTLYVAEAGTGGDTCVMFGEGEEAIERCVGLTGGITQVMDGDDTQVVSSLPSGTFMGEIVGTQDVLLDGDALYGLVGIAADPALRDVLGDDAASLGYIVTASGDGGWEPAIDVSGYEPGANPDGGSIDTNPFSFVTVDGGFVVSDAGANALLSVAADGTISTLAVFPPQMVPAPPFLGLPDGTEIPSQAVPTGLTIGPDGAYYVGQLTGFPFPEGGASVWRVLDANGDGDAMDEGETTAYATGFTNVIDVAFDADGTLWVLEITSGGMLNLNPEDPSTMAGALYMVDGDGVATEITALSAELVMPSGLAVGPDGELYISNYGVMAGMGEVIKVTWD